MTQLQKSEPQPVVRTPKQIMLEGSLSLRELKALVTKRPDKEKLVINGKQYLYFTDWQLLGIFNGITTRVTEVKQLTREKPVGDGDFKFMVLEPIGYEAHADAVRDGKVISSAVAICLKEEKNWEKKDWFAICSMAETRACAKSLRNVLQWIVKLPDSQFSDELAEEVVQPPHPQKEAGGKLI